jgi:hypothetical protein
MAIKSVIFSSSVMVPPGLTFTVGEITWTTPAENDNDILVAAQIQSATPSSTTPTATQEIGSTSTTSSTTFVAQRPETRPPLPRYTPRFDHQKSLDDLLRRIDRVTDGMNECQSLIDKTMLDIHAIRDDNILFTARPARVDNDFIPGSGLVITSTPSGRSVTFGSVFDQSSSNTSSPTETSTTFPLGLTNAAAAFQHALGPAMESATSTMCCMAELTCHP